MYDKAFALQEVAQKALFNPIIAHAASRVLGADNEEERVDTLAEFGITLSAMMATLMCELLMSEEDINELNQAISELNTITRNAEDN